MDVQFTLGPFNVETMDYAGYQYLIEKLRSSLQDRLVLGVPVLAVQENPPTRFFDLILRTNDHSVRFRFQSDNLYLLGYVPLDKKGKPSTHWLEFNNEQLEPLIKERKVKFLGFGGSYLELERAAQPLSKNKKERAARPPSEKNKENQKMTFGVHSLRKAINELAETEAGQDSSEKKKEARQKRARSLHVVIMMISEATRFRTVFDHMARGFDKPGTSRATEVKMQRWITESVSAWESKSKALLRADVFVEELGILLGLRLTPNGEEIRTSVACYAEPSEDFSVQINKEVGDCFLLGLLFGACFLLGLLYGNVWIRGIISFLIGSLVLDLYSAPVGRGSRFHSWVGKNLPTLVRAEC